MLDDRFAVLHHSYKLATSAWNLFGQDFDVRWWNYPTRVAMVNYHTRARDAEVEIGYLLEGKARFWRKHGSRWPLCQGSAFKAGMPLAKVGIKERVGVLRFLVGPQSLLKNPPRYATDGPFYTPS